MHAGTKFNSRKEDAVGEEYLGITVYRFYFKCPRCSAELVMRTDPKNSDYTVEAGASRNYEPWRDADAQARARALSLERCAAAALTRALHPAPSPGGGSAQTARGGGGRRRDEGAGKPHA